MGMVFEVPHVEASLPYSPCRIRRLILQRMSAPAFALLLVRGHDVEVLLDVDFGFSTVPFLQWLTAPVALDDRASSVHRTLRTLVMRGLLFRPLP